MHIEHANVANVTLGDALQTQGETVTLCSPAEGKISPENGPVTPAFSVTFYGRAL